MKSIRGQLLAIFLSFILVSLITATFTAYYFHNKEELILLDRSLHELEIVLLQSLKEQENYFNFETVNEAYYLSGSSRYLENYEDRLDQLKELIVKLSLSPQLKKSSRDQLGGIRNSLTEFEKYFKQIIQSIRIRGFRDFGLVGEMRVAAHRLEDESLIPKEKILMLRRHEKDYIIRQSDLYLEKHSKLMNESFESLAKAKNTTSSEKELTIDILSSYDSLFKRMARIDKLIGLKTNQGLKKILNEHINEILEKVSLLKVNIHEIQESQIRKLNYSLLGSWIGYLLLSSWLCFKISGKFTRRISQLSRHINYFVNTNFTARLATDIKISEDEIGMLWRNFLKMENEIVEYLELFKDKVDEKTRELSDRNQLIELQKEELEKQKLESDAKNKDLLDGMKYGWRIQNALLPSKIRFKKDVEQGFVLFKPKDIVSGDVYFTHKINRRDGIENIFSVIDCTGHGVPGAFMSILAMNAINNAVVAIKHREPHYILQEANNFIYSSMKYYLSDFNSYQNNKDGMDLLICKLKREQNQLSFAGAHRPLYLVRNLKRDKGLGIDKVHYRFLKEDDQILYEILPVKKTVGTIRPDKSKLFVKHDIKVQKGDMLYLSSDGYADQFGGSADKKFMSKRLKKLLCSLYNLPVEAQKEHLEHKFEEWKGENDQIDDVCLMGVRI